MINKTYAEKGGASFDLGDEEIDELFSGALSNALADLNNAGSVIALPPDITRYHSRAGFLTSIASRELGNKLGAVLPALGTHTQMTLAEIKKMFPGVPQNKFIIHNWRNDVTELGRLEADWVGRICEGAVRYDWPVQVNKILCKNGNDSGNLSMILSLGQVVPHEVAGMANHCKNIFIGTGGKEAIDKSHFAGAAYGMEKIMGRIDTPVRSFFDEGFRRFSHNLPPVLWALTVVSARTDAEIAKAACAFPAVRGLYIGFGRECFEKAAKLAQEININIIDEPVKKAVVYLAPDEFRTTWLGNKAIYRTRMAMADNGELLILAPGLERFGEDLSIDALIRKYGYRSSKEIFDLINAAKPGSKAALNENLSAAAHLIHGSSDGRFTIRYCTASAPGKLRLTRQEIESAGFEWGDLNEALERYDINKLNSGWNTLPGEERIFFVSNPALGLWAKK